MQNGTAAHNYTQQHGIQRAAGDPGAYLGATKTSPATDRLYKAGEIADGIATACERAAIVSARANGIADRLFGSQLSGENGAEVNDIPGAGEFARCDRLLRDLSGILDALGKTMDRLDNA